MSSTELTPRKRILAGIPGALDALKKAGKKAETMERTLDAVGVAHKATLTPEEVAKGVIDDMKADLVKVLSRYVEIDDTMAKDITAMVLSAAMNAGAETEEVVEEIPAEEMAVDPDAPTEPLDDDDDPLQKKAQAGYMVKQTQLIGTLITSLDNLGTEQVAITKTLASLDAKADAAIRAETVVKALMERVGKVEAALSLRPRASVSSDTDVAALKLPSDVQKALDAAAQDVVTHPMWGEIKVK